MSGGAAPRAPAFRAAARAGLSPVGCSIPARLRWPAGPARVGPRPARAWWLGLRCAVWRLSSLAVPAPGRCGVVDFPPRERLRRRVSYVYAPHFFFSFYSFCVVTLRALRALFGAKAPHSTMRCRASTTSALKRLNPLWLWQRYGCYSTIVQLMQRFS